MRLPSSLAWSITAISWLLFAGCDGPRTTKTLESRSPDKKFVIRVYTQEMSGMGTGSSQTDVYLDWFSEKQPTTLILDLDNYSATQEENEIQVNWIDSKHVELTYRGPHTVSFQALRCHDIEVTTRNLPVESINNK